MNLEQVFTFLYPHNRVQSSEGAFCIQFSFRIDIWILEHTLKFYPRLNVKMVLALRNVLFCFTLRVVLF